jgi:CubicO group peptidase (beta-lactamase class C family)/Tfp pilus assembly protein PilF
MIPTTNSSSLQARLVAALLAGIALGSGEQVTAQHPRAKAQADGIEAFLRRQMERRRIPGLQVAVVRHGKVVLLGAYGLANVEHSVPVTKETVFSINSATKSFTGVAIMQLVEDGKLDLGAPVSKYLDGLPEAWRPVTIRQLLTLTSGIPGITVEGGDEEAAWAKVQTRPMEFAPGERFSYTQTNYLLLGRIIDKLAGQPFTRFIAERQFQAVGMPRTGFGDSYDVVPHGAQAYTTLRSVRGQYVRTDKLTRRFDEFPPSLRTAAGINTTAEELARWLIALQGGRLLRAKTSLATLWAPVALNNGTPSGWALGWPARVRPEHRAVAGIGGMRSAFFVYPDDDLAVVVLTNLSGASPESFIDEVAGYYIPEMHASAGFGLPPAIKAVHAELLKRGFDHALEVVKEAKKRDAKFRLQEDEVNAWGYSLLEAGQVKEAVEVFKLNVSLYPKSANVYDSLAEAYEEAGDKASAVKNFKRSLELNPKNKNAEEHLKKLEGREGAKASPPPAPLQTSAKPAQVIARLEARLPRLMKEGEVPGLAIALVRDGELAWHRGFGVKNSKTKEPVDDATVFEAASLSKPVFAYAVLKLVDQGKFDLDKPLNQYLPGNYYVGDDARLSKITARRVLSHTSGLPNSRGQDKLKIYFNPGERFSYSSEGVLYLAKVIEHLTGEKLEDFMKQTVFEPLGMTGSSYIWQESYDKLKAYRHNLLGAPVGQHRLPPELRYSAYAPGSLSTTPRDYGRFIRAMLNGTGLKPETRKLMLTPVAYVCEGGGSSIENPQAKRLSDVAWGLGWGLQTTKDGLSFWHWGDNGDSQAFVVAFDQPKLGVVFFANSANGLSIAREIVAEAVGGAQPALDWLGYERYNSPSRVLFRQIIAQGATAALREYRSKGVGRPASEALDERHLTILGYDLLGLKRVDDALEVFKLNVSLYPQSANAYDSLAEGYEAAGDKASAIKNFKRSLELNPKNSNATEHLKKLEAGAAKPDPGR